MIESVYWKTELFSQADKIEALQRCPRWTEKHAVLLEREIMIAAFCIRSLIERQKIADSLSRKAIDVTAFPIRQGMHANRINRFDIDELYHMESPEKRQIQLDFLTNQIIHSYTIFPIKDYDEKKFSRLYVCSDYEKNKRLYDILISDLVALMREVGLNYPSRYEYNFDEEKKEYRVKVS